MIFELGCLFLVVRSR